LRPYSSEGRGKSGELRQSTFKDSFLGEAEIPAADNRRASVSGRKYDSRASLLADDLRASMIADDFLHKTDSVVHTMPVKSTAGSGSENCSCTVFFPYLFEQLRELLEPDGNKKYMESIMNSHSVELTGGQVGSFLQTKDGRFIIKMIKKVEAESFGKHAKKYVEYIYQRVADVEEIETP